MSSDIPDTVEAVFLKAATLSPRRRKLYLQMACYGRPTLRRDVEQLLRASDAGDDYLHDLAGRLNIQSMFEQIERAAVPTQPFGVWRAIAHLGTGGMGAVYLAERADAQFEQRAAIKVLPAAFASEHARQRFLVERQILAGLQHPYIAQLLDGGLTNEGLPYFVMEYVQGCPVEAWCDERRLSVEARLALFTDICEAVQFAHRNLIIHRDIKPANVMVDEEGRVRLLDFGIAKLLDPQHTGSEVTSLDQRPMSAPYASPEMICGDPVTTASDVYSLGVLLYVLLTGRLPSSFDGMTERERRDAVSGAPCPLASHVLHEVQATGGELVAVRAACRASTPAQLRHRLQGDLDLVLAKALARDPEQRYASVQAFAEDVQRHLHAQPVHARTPSWGYLARRFVARNRWAVGTAALMVLCLISITVLTARYAVRTAEQAHEVAQAHDDAQQKAYEARQTRDFLLSIFELSGPNATQGQTVSAASLLDRAAQRLEDDLGELPGTAAVLHGAIAEIYQQMSLYEQSQRMFVRARALFEAAGDEDGAAFAQVTEQYASLTEVRGEYPKAYALALQGLATYEAIGDQAGIARMRLILGRNHHKQGNLPRARAEYNAAVTLLESLPEPSKDTLAAAKSYLGTLAEHEGDLAGAEALHLEGLALRQEFYGDQHTVLIESYHNLATAVQQQGRLREAEAHYDEALRISALLSPSGNSSDAFLYNGLGKLHELAGDLALSVSNYERALAVLARYFESPHANTGIVLGNLARAQHQLGLSQAAHANLLDGIDVLNATVPAHPRLPQMRVLLEQIQADAHPLIADAAP